MRSPQNLLSSSLNKPNLIGEIFQPSAHLLDILQQLHIFLLWEAQDLDTVLQMEPHNGRGEGHNPLSLSMLPSLLMHLEFFHIMLKNTLHKVLLNFLTVVWKMI